jgi:hypothetical protein
MALIMMIGMCGIRLDGYVILSGFGIQLLLFNAGLKPHAKIYRPFGTSLWQAIYQVLKGRKMTAQGFNLVTASNVVEYSPERTAYCNIGA